MCHYTCQVNVLNNAFLCSLYKGMHGISLRIALTVVKWEEVTWAEEIDGYISAVFGTQA